MLGEVPGTERHERKTSQCFHHQGAKSVVEETHFQVSNAVRGCDGKEGSFKDEGGVRRTSLRSGGLWEGGGE